MKITALEENLTCFHGYQPDEGLSLFIRTRKHCILFDFGYHGVFLDNAQKMGVDIRDVDVAVLSHSHDDHCNGIADFLKVNQKAKVYLQKSSFDGIYESVTRGTPEFIGVDPALKDNPRLVLLDGSFVIDDEIEIFAGVRQDHETAGMFKMENGRLVPDDFRHEQYLVVHEDNKTKVITGCSHCGIVNILKNATEKYGVIDSILGGFHIIAYDLSLPSDRQVVAQIGEDLKSFNTMCYTCHCTSADGYELLKTVMGDCLGYISTGVTLRL